MDITDRSHQAEGDRDVHARDIYLRLMYLKHRYTLGYEMLVREVADSLHWRRFCHIPLEGEVPHPTTLSKLTRKYGPAVIAELNHLLVGKLREQKLVQARKLRVDTTVIQAPMEHPTDIGLLADSVRVMTRTVKRLQAAGAAMRTTFRNRLRTVKRALRTVGRALRTRTGDATTVVEQQTARVLQVTRQAVRQAERILVNSRRAAAHQPTPQASTIHRGRDQLQRTLQLTRQVMVQTTQRLKGVLQIPNRVVSVFDPEARARSAAGSSARKPSSGTKRCSPSRGASDHPLRDAPRQSSGRRAAGANIRRPCGLGYSPTIWGG